MAPRPSITVMPLSSVGMSMVRDNQGLLYTRVVTGLGLRSCCTHLMLQTWLFHKECLPFGSVLLTACLQSTLLC
jgi:hypothetical protein